MKILLIDDDKEFLVSWKKALEGRGHEVEAAPDVNNVDVKELVKAGYDLALVDSRLTPDNPADRLGLNIALHLHSRGLPTVLVTAYTPPGPQMFEFLRLSQLAGIIRKPISGGERLGLVDFYALRRRCPNGIATFKYQPKTGPAVENEDAWKGLMELLKPSVPPGVTHNDIAVLFRGLVSPCATAVTMRAIAKGKSGAALVRATVSFGDGPVTDDVAIKFGATNLIRSEALRYDRFCGPLPDGVVTQLRWRVETLDLGALAYSWVGDADEDGQPLNSNEIHWEPRRETIKRLFRKSLLPWVKIFRAGTSTRATAQLLTDYYKDKGGIWYAEVTDLKTTLPKTAAELPPSARIAVKDGQWDFGASGIYLDPVKWVLEGKGKEMKFYVEAPSHGDLHARNVFVLPGNLPRLIDFGRTGLGHVFRDFAALEASLRVACVQPATLADAREIEDCLCDTLGLGEAIVSDGRFDAREKFHTKQVIETIKELRRWATDGCASKNRAEDVAQYHFAVLMHMLRYAQGIADEVTDETPNWRAIRIWQAHYGAARLASQLDALLD